MTKQSSGEKGGLVMKLFISGASPRSMRAVSNLKMICEKANETDYSLEIIDVNKETIQLGIEQIVALPMLVKKFPLPERKLIGDLSNVLKVMKSLGLKLV